MKERQGEKSKKIKEKSRKWVRKIGSKRRKRTIHQFVTWECSLYKSVFPCIGPKSYFE